MPLLKNEEIIDDSWVRIADDEPLPSDGFVLVSVGRWQAECGALSGCGDVGVYLGAGDNPEAIAGELNRIPVIALDFPAFTDGRSYSNARLLRERFGYAGELRAVGEVLRDQYAFMLDCGFDAFDVPEGTRAEDWERSAGAIRVTYQPGMARGAAAMTLRHQHAISADFGV